MGEGEIYQLQDQVGGWVLRNFPTDTRQTAVLGAAEEVGELCRAALKHYQGIRGTAEEWEAEVRKETADVFLKLCHVAVLWGFDLGSVIDTRWAEISERDWITDPVGHGLPAAAGGEDDDAA
jgi:NTP pyrophosphatase (non-canonical NTP hydrolase)